MALLTSAFYFTPGLKLTWLVVGDSSWARGCVHLAVCLFLLCYLNQLANE